jgi:hypothetical protein
MQSMSIKKQMELFEDGGLKDEGGTVDPVSGNDVPPGSTQEEVRDDIPAQLSEGEFVFPADVVRYIGLENLMSMRQDAKQGLAQMEAMGQMGNSEEATIPDDLPFDIYDLDIEDDEPLEMQVGGYVPGVYTQPSYLSQYGQQVSQVTPSVVSVPSAQQFRPPTYTPPEYKGPTFEDIIPSPTGSYDELRTFVNDEGLIRQIPFIDGKPIYPIPEGFYPQEKAKETIQTPTTVGRTQVTEEGGGGRDDSDDSKYGGSTISLGGTVEGGNVVGGTTYGLTFDQMTPNMVKNIGFAGAVKSLFGGKPTKLGKDESATVVDKTTDTKVSIPASVYNEIRTNLTGTTAKSVKNLIDKINGFKSAGATNKSLNEAYAKEQVKNIERAMAVREAQRTGKFGDRDEDSETGYTPGSVIDRAIKDATAEVAADEDETFSSVPAEGKGYEGVRSDTTSGGDADGSDSDSDSGGSKCFAAGVKFIMEDGTTKNIESIKIGDKLKLGGHVNSTIQGDGLVETWYNYGTTKVTGNHAIFERGEWKRVKDAKEAILNPNKEKVLYTLTNENHRMISEDGVIYTDYDEVDNTGIEEDLLAKLNKQNADATAA